jgi:hypothetical protein
MNPKNALTNRTASAMMAAKAPSTVDATLAQIASTAASVGKPDVESMSNDIAQPQAHAAWAV